MEQRPSDARRPKKPLLRYSHILAWADAHHARTGEWPDRRSGEVEDALWTTWARVDSALRYGSWSLRPGSSLLLFLFERRGVRNKYRPPPLDIDMILSWADRHHKKTRQWPNYKSGAVSGAPGETWSVISAALFSGRRGLPGNSSLARLLMKHRAVYNKACAPRLTVKKILSWADTYRRLTGRWPTTVSGPISEAPNEAWIRVNNALTHGQRGLRKGQSLARVLHKYRGARLVRNRPRLTLTQILTWADAHRRRTGRWPRRSSGPIWDAPDETWSGVNDVLVRGGRGLGTGWTLARVLHQYRGARMVKQPPRLTLTKILTWADAHRRRTGRWPAATSGPIHGVPGETWTAINVALFSGGRGLKPGLSLTRLLEKRRGVRNVNYPGRLTVKQILDAADRHHKRTGRWPKPDAGAVLGMPGERWSAFNHALLRGHRGLPSGSSLPRLLEERRGVRNRKNLPRLKVRQILAWADAHHQQTGQWPMSKSGAIFGAPGEQWPNVNTALRAGVRGLPGGSSLAQLLQRHRGARNRSARPRLTIKQILAWADAHHARTRQWPRKDSGSIPRVRHDTWAIVNGALRGGHRGLSGDTTLAKLLAKHGRGRSRK